MARYGMVIDVGRCIGCYNCVLACRDEHAGNDHAPIALAQPPTGQKWIDVHELERGSFPKVKLSHLPVLCQHCEHPACANLAPAGAVYRRDGMVLFDPEKAAGRREIVDSCPYRVVFWNEARNAPQKCTFCAHLLDAGWKEPRCVEVCPTQAMVFGDLDQPDSAIAQMHVARSLETLHPEYGMKPSVHYLGLPRRFLAGEIVLNDRSEEPAHGVRVTLACKERRWSTTTDNYGDFEFDGLEPQEYVLRAEHPDYQPQELRVRLLSDHNIGAIVLHPRAPSEQR